VYETDLYPPLLAHRAARERREADEAYLTSLRGAKVTLDPYLGELTDKAIRAIVKAIETGENTWGATTDRAPGGDGRITGIAPPTARERARADLEAAKERLTDAIRKAS
jgi:hypothetical protein